MTQQQQQQQQQPRQRLYPPLWRQCETQLNTAAPTMERLMQAYSHKPKTLAWSIFAKNALVVGQEFTFSCFFLARHRSAQYEEQGLIQEGDFKQTLSLAAVLSSLLLVALHSDSQRSRQKTQTRLMDAILLAALLRLLAAALRTLTASFSSDTVHALAVTGMIIHFMGCDYSYANGLTNLPLTTRAFLGGTMSLNAAFFSTTLLASRLSSNWTVYLFVSSSVTIFAFFPATRHGLFIKSPDKAHHVIILSTMLLMAATWILLETPLERALFLGILLTICLVIPTWKYYLQRYKIHINGPWDIAQIAAQST